MTMRQEMRQFRCLAGAAAAGLTAVGVVAAPPAHAAARLTVTPGQSIQHAVDAAHPGDTVVLLPGTYRQSVRITVSGLRLVGAGAGEVTLEPPAATAATAAATAANASTATAANPSTADAVTAATASTADAVTAATAAAATAADAAAAIAANAFTAASAAAPATAASAAAPATAASAAAPATPVTVATAAKPANACATAGNGICVEGADDVRIEALTVTGYAHYGIWGDGADRLTVRAVNASDNGQYGIGQQKSVQARFTANVARNNGEAGIFLANTVNEEAGALDTKGAVVRANVLTGNKMGVVLRRVRDMSVEANVLSGNCAGMFVVGDEGVPRAGDLTVRRNTVTSNTKYCAPTSRLPFVQGAGIVLTGVENTVVERNTVTGNTGTSPMSGGIVLFKSFVGIPNTGNAIRRNILLDNGPADLADGDTAGTGNTFSGNACTTSLPAGRC
jgi:nitrous oxidase accessory protein NosD